MREYDDKQTHIRIFSIMKVWIFDIDRFACMHMCCIIDLRVLCKIEHELS